MVLDDLLADRDTELRSETAPPAAPASHRPLRPYLFCIVTLWVIVASLLIIFYVCQNDQQLFTGIYGSRFHKWVGYDSTLYLDMIERSRQGTWLFENRFSPETGQALYLNSVWLLAGRTARLLGLSSLNAFTVFRFLAILIFVLALRRLLLEVTDGPRMCNFALLLIIFCGGIGWTFGALGHWYPGLRPLFTEGRSPETNCFLCLLVSPHITLAMALLLWVLSGFVRSSQGSRTARWLTPVLVLALSTFHPYDVAVLYIVGAAYVVLSRLRDGRLNPSLFYTYLASVAVSAPVMAYHRWALTTAPDLQGLRYQNALPPESSLQYAVALMPLGLLALRQLSLRVANFRLANNGQILILAWTLMIPAMVYSYPHISFAWKLGVAMPVPVYILAAEWIEHKLNCRPVGLNTGCRLPRAAIGAAVAISLCSSATTVTAMVRAALSNTDPYYVETSNVDAMRWLAAQGGGKGAVLSARSHGMFMPRLAHKRPVLGHSVQSVDYASKKTFVRSLFHSSVPCKTELRQLRRYGVKWVFCGQYERRWWPKLRPSEHLRLAYDKSGVQIYEVIYGR